MQRAAVAPLLLLLSLGLGPAACGSGEAPPTAYPSPEAVQPLPPGSRVPSATVRGVAGEPLDLAALVAERGALLVFYRGGW